MNEKRELTAIEAGMAETIKRFEEKIFPVTESGCWIWMGGITSRGYGAFFTKRKIISAHRAAHQIYVGPIPKGFLVCHKCDTPACVNPAHLFLGTVKDNNDDKIKKGRCRSGEVNRNKTHCKHGHEFNEKNTTFSRDRRRCRVCDRARKSKRYWEKKLSGDAQYHRSNQ